MAKITYEDKVKLQDKPDIPNKNKVTDNDMNEIKDVVNTNADELDTAKENIENLEEGQGTNSTDITNLKGRMTTLETDNAKNKSDISNLQKDNETNKTNISNLRNNKVDKVEGKGLSTEDFTTALKTKLEGLENYNDTEIQEKIQTIEGKVQTLEDDNVSNKANISTLQGKVTNLEKDNTTNKGNISNLQENVEDLGKDIEENTTNIETLQAENKNLKQEIESYQNSLPRETLSGEYITMQNTADKVKFKDFVLGGNSKQEAEPSPEFPSKIENVEGNVEVTVANKNIANAEQLYQDMLNFNPNVKKEVVDGRNCLVFSNMIFMSNKGFKGLQGKYKENTRYVVRAKCRVQNTGITSGMSLLIEACDKEGNRIGYHNNGANGANWIQFSFLTNADASVDYIAFSYGNNTMWCLDMDSLEIYEATKVEDYVANQQQQVVFPLAQNQKLMLGDYLDDDGIHHVKKQVVLDGTENIIEYGRVYPSMHAYRVTINNLKANTKAICSKYKNVTFSEFYNVETDHFGEFAVHNTSNTYAYFGSYKATVEEFKEEIKGSVLEYEMLEEEIEPYTNEQKQAYNKLKQLTTYAGQTNIYSTNNIKPVFKVTGIKDVNSLIENTNAKIEAINELLSTTATSAMLLDNMQSDLESEVM